MYLIDMQDFKFKVGDVFETYDRHKDQIRQCQVEEVLDEMLKVKYLTYVSDNYGQQVQSAWISRDTDKFQPKDTYKN